MVLDVRSAPKSREYHRLLDGTSRTAISVCGLTFALFEGTRFLAAFFFVGILFATST
jgi:hypothetical protein